MTSAQALALQAAHAAPQAAFREPSSSHSSSHSHISPSHSHISPSHSHSHISPSHSHISPPPLATATATGTTSIITSRFGNLLDFPPGISPSPLPTIDQTPNRFNLITTTTTPTTLTTKLDQEHNPFEVSFSGLATTPTTQGFSTSPGVVLLPPLMPSPRYGSHSSSNFDRLDHFGFGFKTGFTPGGLGLTPGPLLLTPISAALASLGGGSRPSDGDGPDIFSGGKNGWAPPGDEPKGRGGFCKEAKSNASVSEEGAVRSEAFLGPDIFASSSSSSLLATALPPAPPLAPLAPPPPSSSSSSSQDYYNYGATANPASAIPLHVQPPPSHNSTSLDPMLTQHFPPHSPQAAAAALLGLRSSGDIPSSHRHPSSWPQQQPHPQQHQIHHIHPTSHQQLPPPSPSKPTTKPTTTTLKSRKRPSSPTLSNNKKQATNMKRQRDDSVASSLDAAADQAQFEIDTKDMDPEEKRKTFLERNRQAALKCRQKKKQWLQSLQSKVEFLTSDNENLTVQATQLREEVLNLKTLLLAHRECPVANRNGLNLGVIERGVGVFNNNNGSSTATAGGAAGATTGVGGY
ncbi:hypothetical protein DFS34DRAFT_281710 [Phlyctochytrium arcticum]|nr:hypothetical protein DFS34DRAFT_281710 [Phlyctochytrium arcticum]